MNKEYKNENVHVNPDVTIVEDYCDIMIDEKHRGLYMSSHPCNRKAVCKIYYKLASKSDNIKSKKCCTRHKNMFLRQIDRDDFAELVRVENLRNSTDKSLREQVPELFDGENG